MLPPHISAACEPAESGPQSFLVWPHGVHIYTLWLALFIVAAGMFYIASRNYLRHRGVLRDKDDEEE